MLALFHDRHMGAVMGGLFASGMDSRRIEEVASQITFKDYFRLNLLKFLVKGYRHASVYKGRTFHEFLRRWLPQQHFADLPRPFFCNALSLKTGKSRFFGLPGADDVPVGDAVYASACLPAVFEPMELDGDHYIDGGMTETLGLRLAKARTPDLVIAVDLSHRDLHAETPYRASLPHILSLRIPGIVGETLMLRCDERGVAFSTGSACHGHNEESRDPKKPDHHVLAAIGMDRRSAREVIRVSFSRNTSVEDAEFAAEVIVDEALALLRTSPAAGGRR